MVWVTSQEVPMPLRPNNREGNNNLGLGGQGLFILHNESKNTIKGNFWWFVLRIYGRDTHY